MKSLVATDDNWMAQAECGRQDLDLNIFFPRSKEERRIFTPRALEVCKSCPVRIECKTYAIAHRIREGTWGGMTASQRAKIPRHQRTEIRRRYFAMHPSIHPLARHAGPFL